MAEPSKLAVAAEVTLREYFAHGGPAIDLVKLLLNPSTHPDLWHQYHRFAEVWIKEFAKVPPEQTDGRCSADHERAFYLAHYLEQL